MGKRRIVFWGAAAGLVLALAGCSEPDHYSAALGDYACVQARPEGPQPVIARVLPERLEFFATNASGAPADAGIWKIEYTDFTKNRDGRAARVWARETTSPQEVGALRELGPSQVAIDRHEDPAITIRGMGEVRFECVPADISGVIAEAEAAFQEARSRAQRLRQVASESWFLIAGSIRDESPCDVLRSSLIEAAQGGSMVANAAANRIGASAERLGCLSTADFKPPPVPGLGSTTPHGWAERVMALARSEASPATAKAAAADERAPAVAKPAKAQPVPPRAEKRAQPRQEAVAPVKDPARTPAPPPDPRPETAPSDAPGAADLCMADAPLPRTDEERAVTANGRRHLTGRVDRSTASGEYVLVEAALGYDGQCRPDPFQVYVFRAGKQVGTLSPKAMNARTDGAIQQFRMLDDHRVEIQVARYAKGEGGCCPSSVDTRVVDLRTLGAAPPKTGSAARGPSFDCAKAATETERAICASPRLAALDLEMATLYRSRMGALQPDAAARLRQSQREWLAARPRQCGADETCLEAYFRERIEALGQ